MDYVTTSALHFAYQSTAVWWLIAQLFKAWPIWLQWLCNWVSIRLSPNQFELGCISHTCKKGFFYRFSLAFFYFFFGGPESSLFVWCVFLSVVLGRYWIYSQTPICKIKINILYPQCKFLSTKYSIFFTNCHDSAQCELYWKIFCSLTLQSLFSHYQFDLKALYTFGYWRPVFSLGVSHRQHQITSQWKFELNWSSILRQNDERNTPLLDEFVCFQNGIKDI